MTSELKADFEQATTWSIVLGVLMVIAGIIAISLPLATGIFAALWIGFILLPVGIAKLVYAWQTHDMGGFALQWICQRYRLGAVEQLSCFVQG